MMPTGLVYDDRFCHHDTGSHHPERPDRLRAIIRKLQSQPFWNELVRIPAVSAELHWILGLHDPDYVRRVKAACESGQPYLDTPDSAICPRSYDIALLAVGSVLAAVDAVMQAKVDNAFCAVRPPGHHAERDHSMGFCLFNNIAIAAYYLLTHYSLQRVAIVDWDVHHGNGTQHLFEHRSDVLFISLHEDPSYLYPGTGHISETGSGHGEGFTINLALPPGSGDQVYQRMFEKIVLPALDHFSPQFLLISAGFDASEADPLAHMRLTPQGFIWMTQQLLHLAKQHCQGRLVSVLEGGYDLASLSECVLGHVAALMGKHLPVVL